MASTTSTPLTPAQAAIVKSTVPVLAEHGVTITTAFYTTLLKTHPSLHNIFNSTHQTTKHQPLALAGALHAYAANLDALGNLAPALELICHKHVSLGIVPEQYSVVGAGVLAAMRDVLGADVATDEVLEAWGAAYWQLANIMIAKEAELYKASSSAKWDGFRDFKIVRKEMEADDITSFYFEPRDAGDGFVLPVWKPGQYVSLQLFVPQLEGGVYQARQYSLSDAPGRQYLRVSVKREDGFELAGGQKTRDGYVSHLLHAKEVGDTVRVSHPFGDFYLDEEEHGQEVPVVLISAGVGLTCLLGMLNAVTSEGKVQRKVSWIHGARTKSARAFKSHVDELAENNDNLQTTYFNSAPGPNEVQGRDYDVVGRVDLERVPRGQLHLENQKTRYFVCGPTQFMLDVQAKLGALSVDAERISVELFGTGGVPSA